MNLVEFTAEVEIEGVRFTARYSQGTLTIAGVTSEQAFALLDDAQAMAKAVALARSTQSVPQDTHVGQCVQVEGERSPAPPASDARATHVDSAQRASASAPVLALVPPNGTAQREQNEAQDTHVGKSTQEAVPPAASADSLAQALVGARQLRDVLSVLIEAGHKTAEALKAQCREWRDRVPVLQRIAVDALDGRVERTADLLGIGNPDMQDAG